MSKKEGVLTISTEPSVEPITLAEVQTHLRLDTTDSSEDSLINQLIKTARKRAELYTDRAFIDTAFVWYLESFDNEIVLPRGPLDSVTHIKYLDTDGAEQTVSSSVYQTDAKHPYGRVVIEDGQNWPTVHSYKVNPIYITFTCGYGTSASDVPSGIKDALLRMVGTLYEAREDCDIMIGLLTRAYLKDYKLNWNT